MEKQTTQTQENTILKQWDREQEAKLQSELEDSWKTRTTLNEQTLVGAIEALIFMNDKPLSIQKIKKSIDEHIPLRLIHESIEALQAKYEEDHHGIRIIEVADGYQFRTKTKFTKIIQTIHKLPQITLSPLALEVLSIVSFKQPISKVDLDSMRGVDSGHLLRGLMDKGLVKIVGRSDEMGKSATYGTTDGFLELFNLKELEDLPTMNDLEEMVQDNSIGDIEDIQKLVKSDKEKFMFDEMEELEKLKEEIQGINTQTQFTQSLKDNAKAKKKDEESKTDFDILEEHIEPAKEEVEISASDVKDQMDAIKSENNEEKPLFDNEEKLTEMLDDAFDKIHLGNAVDTIENEENTDSEVSSAEQFEISELNAIKENLNNID